MSGGYQEISTRRYQEDIKDALKDNVKNSSRLVKIPGIDNISSFDGNITRRSSYEGKGSFPVSVNAGLFEN